MAVLYKLADSYNQVVDMADRLDDGTLRDTLDSIKDAFDVKAENVAKAVKEIEGQANMIDEEIKRLTKRKTTMKNNAKSMKVYLQEQMEAIGKRKVQGELLTVAIQKNAPSVKIESEQYIPEGFYVPQPSKLDKTQLKNELKNGLEITGVELVQTESVRIK
ncbi:siphovirus Gp157 family protein [Enterococcus gilvus]|uniref:siphovirus Gp157 family protein n=1 Tax=Enterococcus gilvus TaxID=160453 RepID=UPI001C8C771E|nr:siphovirus Gp157 family protein [Enterococcus gilvus]MBX8938515.1 siphovirus Gp157 family protein [Enterococcus gilvus]